MCGPAAIPILAAASAVVSAGGQLYSGMAQNSQAKYEARVADINQGVEIRARDDAAQRGEIAQMQQWRKVAQQYGDQRAKQAASGLDISFGSPADLLTDVSRIGGEDASTIAQNTVREMRGYEVNAANYTMQGRAALSRGKAALIGSGIQAFSTILAGASQVSKMGAARSGAATGYGS
jgi:hypothetical protein